jgi:hypothetical protein
MLQAQDIHDRQKERKQNNVVGSSRHSERRLFQFIELMSGCSVELYKSFMLCISSSFASLCKVDLTMGKYG